jgi:hypothetical protein
LLVGEANDEPLSHASDDVVEPMLTVALLRRCWSWRWQVNVDHGMTSMPSLAGYGAIIPQSEKIELKPLHVCPRYSNHTYSNNMLNRYNISIKLQTKILQNTPWVRKKITEYSSGRNLSADGASIGTTGG